MSPIIDQLTQQVNNAIGVEQSAITLINGIAQRIQDAINQALENGATAEQLQPVSDLSNQMQAESDALAAAIQANTPPPPP